ncbi:YPDG domain-containing protein, partial [Limosilactobacillus agrestis]
TDLSGTAENNAPVTGLAAKDDNVITSNGNGVVTGKNSKGTWAAMDATTPAAPEAYKNSQDVTDWSSFINALEDANVDNINITHDITVTGKTGSLGGQSLGYNGCLTFKKENVARKVTITGNGNTIDFGHYSLMFQDANQKNGSGWDIIIDDTKLKGVSKDGSGQTSATEPGQFGLISFADVNSDNQKKDTVTFNNVTANVEGRSVITGAGLNHSGEYYTLVLTGDNDVTASEDLKFQGTSGSALDAGYVRIDNGTTNINVTSAYDGSNNYGGNAIRTAQTDIHNNDGSTIYTFDIKKGATLNITGGANARGIYAVDGVHGTANIDGTVNMDLGTGHSMAVFAGQLNVGKDGVLDVTAATDATPDFGQVARSISNFNGGQYGVINIGVGQPINTTNVDSTTINDDGIIRVKRTSTNSGMNPIISMGSGSSAVLKGTFTINVNQGATLDLQDSRQQTNLGMIFVSGSSANSNINIVNPKYVNLQRLNTPLPSNGSDLIYLEGGGQSGRTNGVHISNTPIAEWQAANTSTAPNFTWMVQSVNSMNNWGTNAGSGFTVAGQTAAQNKDGQEKFLYSNGNVIMAPSQSGTNSFEYNGSQTVNKNSNQGIIVQGAGSVNYYTPYLNQFLNNYSYWTPQRLAMGSQLLTPDSPVPVKDNDLYDPEVQTINGNTRETLNDLDPKDGIKDLLKATMDADGNWTKTTVPVDGNVQSVAWYTPADATDWSNNMSGIDAPTNPEGNLKTTDTSAWAKVTYNDGSIDFVNIPLNITDKTNADIYTPSYQDTSVKQGESVTTEAPTYTTDDGKAATAPAGTTYKIDDSFKAPAGATVTIDSTTGKITVNAGANTPVGEIDVPVTVTYPGDNSTDNVTAKITVTASDANTYTPSYQDTTVKRGSETTIPVTITGADGKTTTVPAGTQFKAGDFTTPDGATIAVDPTSGEIKVTTKDNTPVGEVDIPVTVTYPDGSVDNTTAKVTISNNDADNYNPKYNPAKVNQGGKVETGVPSYGEGITAPTGTTYKIPDGTTYPTGVTATVDPNTGNVTVTTSSNTPEGPIFVPVTVTYPDGSQETIDAPIAVGSNTFIGTDYSVTVETNLNNLHETTANSMYPDATSTISKITYWNNNDVRKGINTQGTVVYDRANGTGNLTGVSAEWTTPINTNVDSATSSETLPGTGTSTVSDVNPAIKVTYGANSDLIKDTGNGLFTPQGGNQTVRWYGNAVTVQGATPVADAASKKLVVSPAKAGDALTDAEKALLDLTNLDKLTANKPVSYTWANDLKAGDTKGTVKITFSDKAKDGQATYLNVELPAGSLNVGTEDATGKPIVTPQGQEPNPEQGIGNVPDLPTGTTYTWKDGEPDVSKIGESPVTVTVHYPDGNTQDVPTTIIVTGTEKPTDPTSDDQKDLFKTVTRTIDGTTPDGKKVSDPQTVVFARTKTVTEQDGKAVTTYGDYKVFENGAQTDKTTGSFAKVDVPQVDGYTSQVDGNNATVIPAVDNVTPDTENVTVNVTYKETDAHKYTPEGQDVHTNIGGTPEASQGIGNIPSLPTGTTYTWKDGEPDTKTPGTKDAVVVVNYPDGSSEDVPVKVIVSEATPTPIVTPQGQEPNPEQGIGNVPDLPTGTTYTWKDGKTPDVSKIGESPVTVTVHYPDGNTQDVPTTIIVTGTEKPTDPTSDDQKDLFKTVTRTIDGTTPDGKKVSDPQTVVFARTKTVIEQDGKAVTTFGDYKVFENGAQTDKTTGSFAQVDVPQVDGYTSQVDGNDATVIPANNNVTPNTADVTVNVTYNIDSETQQYQFVDKTNGQNVGDPISVKGDFGKQVRVSLTVPDNYELAEGQTLPTETPVLGVTNPVIKIYLDHKTEDVTNDPSEDKNVNKTITRTIDYVDPTTGETKQYKVQSVQFHRTATKDLVTGDVNYGAWSPVGTPKFDAVTAPTIDGYTASNADAAPAMDVTAKTEDSTVTFVYGADQHSQLINYVDKDGNVIKHYDVTGKTGETVDTNIQSNVPEGWIITDKTVPGQITFGSDNPAPINVTIEHGTKDVTNDPSQADKVNKTVTRTIDLDIAGKTSEYTKQNVTLHRSATEDLVTGEVTYGAWNVDGAKFNAVPAPEEAGYTVTNPNAAPEVAVTGDTQDSTVTFNYTANDQTTTIKYVNNADHNDVVDTKVVSGKTGETVNVTYTAPENWKIVAGQPTGETITFGSTPVEDTIVYVEHGTEDVTDTDADAKSTVTETINVTTPDGKTTPIVKSVTFN